MFCLPHARGGVSTTAWTQGGSHESSPRTWGCFSAGAPERDLIFVFPTHVGVFLHQLRNLATAHRLPHARGGVSGAVVIDADDD